MDGIALSSNTDEGQPGQGGRTSHPVASWISGAGEKVKNVALQVEQALQRAADGMTDLPAGASRVKVSTPGQWAVL